MFFRVYGSIPRPVPGQQIPTAATTFPAVTATSPAVTPPFSVVSRRNISFAAPLKILKDYDSGFTIQVPASWDVITEKMPIPEGYSGIVYLTSLYNNQGFVNTHEFFILTYASSRDYDQTMRTYFRDTWTPKAMETTVRINGITLDRFESKITDDISVAYVARKSSANERGFASVIECSVNTSSEYNQQDYESNISRFRYLDANSIKTAPGEEIKKGKVLI
jgi:hypothetical protein